MNGQPQLQPVQGVANPNFPLDLCIRQSWHDSTAFHICSASSHIPGWHPNPQLKHTRKGSEWELQNIPGSKTLNSLQVCTLRGGSIICFGGTTDLQPHNHSWPIPLGKRQTLSSGFLQQLMPTITEIVINNKEKLVITLPFNYCIRFPIFFPRVGFLPFSSLIWQATKAATAHVQGLYELGRRFRDLAFQKFVSEASTGTPANTKQRSQTDLSVRFSTAEIFSSAN